MFYDHVFTLLRHYFMCKGTDFTAALNLLNILQFFYDLN
jgi:hypothetical protein